VYIKSRDSCLTYSPNHYAWGRGIFKICSGIDSFPFGNPYMFKFMAKLSLSPQFVAASATDLENISEFQRFSGLGRFQLSQSRTRPLEELLFPLWRTKNIPISASFEKTFFGFGVGGNVRNHLKSGTIVNQGACHLYTLPNATVYPTHSTIALSDKTYVAEKYGANENELSDFINHYAEFFGFCRQSGNLEIEESVERFEPYFGTRKDFSDSSFTPIFLSNHIHDKTFTHWFGIAVYALYLLKDLITEIRNPLFVVSYQLERWQIDTLSFFFQYNNIKLLTIDAPTNFQKIYFLHGVRGTFLDGDFLNYLYQREKRIFPTVNLKLFITRDDAVSRRISNQKELNSLLLSRGYMPIRMGDYSTGDQISLIANSTKIIFVEGSTGINLLHAKTDVRVGMITYPGLSEWEFVLANFGIFQISKFQSEISNRHQAGFDLFIDLNRFEEFLSNEMQDTVSAKCD